MAQGFDPAAATAAYLAQLPPDAHAKATAYTQGGHWVLLWGAMVTVAAAWLILRLGVLVKIRDAIHRRQTSPWPVIFTIMVVYTVQASILSLPWTIYADWWREKQYGMTSQPFAGWVTDWSVGLAIGVLQVTFLFLIIYALIRRAPHTWWLWGGALATVFALLFLVIAPVFVDPLFNHYTPAPPGPVRDTVVAMAKENGIPPDKIYVYNGSKQSNRYTANVSGLFGTARVAMSDVMFKKGADLGEVRGVVGHEMGHYAQQHMVWLAAALGALAMLAFFLIDRLYPVVLRLSGAKGVGDIADPAGYPVIAILFSVLALLGQPLTNSLTRYVESDADRYSLEHAREPDGMARALVKSIEYRAATPSRLEEVIFYDHPSVGARIRRAMDWKALHLAKVSDTADLSPTDCMARGGDMRPMGLSQNPICVIQLADAGNACTDGSQCIGGCIRENAPIARGSGERGEGVCQRLNVQYGCVAEVNNGKVGDSSCRD